VVPGEKARVDLLGVAAGSTVELDRVLLVADGEKTHIGKPTVEGARVIASCTGEEKDDKVIAFKYKAKNRYRRKLGHRQSYTHLAIEKIVMPGGVELSAPARPAPPQAEPVPEPEVKADGA